MRVVEVAWGGRDVMLRDPIERGAFLVGIVCNEYGVALREGCSNEVEMMVYVPNIERMREV